MIKKVEHVAIIVKDMEKSIEFYCGIFGYKLRARGQSPTREIVFIYHEGQPGFEIELIRDFQVKEDYSDRGIVNHLAFTVESIEEAIDFYQRKGIQFNSEKPMFSIDKAKIIFCYGPNRELLQFVERTK